MPKVLNALTLALAACSLCIAVAPQRAGRLSVERDGNRLYLTAKGDSHLIFDPEMRGDLVVPLPDGTTVSIPSAADAKVVVRDADGRARGMPLAETLKRWLKDDAKWAGHRFANFIRGVYNHEGLSVSLQNPTVFNGLLLALLTTNSIRGSGNVVKSQQLVRLQTQPRLAFQMLRLLDLPPQHASDMMSGYPRLFVLKTHLLLFTRPNDTRYAADFEAQKPTPSSDLEEIAPDGKTIQVFAEFPAPLYPLGLLKDRWMLLQLPGECRHPVWIYDLARGRLKPLSGNWKGVTLPHAARVDLPDSGQSIVVEKIDYDNDNKTVLRLIHVPDGRTLRQITLASPSDRFVLWHGMFVTILEHGRRVTVYRAATGRLVKRFRL